MIGICHAFAHHAYNQYRSVISGIPRVSPLGECIYKGTSYNFFPYKEYYYGTRLSLLNKTALIDGKFTVDHKIFVVPYWYPNAVRIATFFATGSDSVMIRIASDTRATKHDCPDYLYELYDGAKIQILEVHKISDAWKKRRIF